MGSCYGDLPVTSKVDRDMREFLDSEAAEYGVTRAEMMRRIFTLYRESRRENTDCPHCGEAVVMDVRE